MRRPELVQAYSLFPLEGRRLPFPLLYVRVRGRRGRLRTVALVDSGATASFIPIEIAEEIGLHLTPGAKAGGGGGDFNTYEGAVTLELLHRRRVVHTFRRMAVSVPREAGRIPCVVLGRDSLFRAFTIIFEEHRSRFRLRPVHS